MNLEFNVNGQIIERSDRERPVANSQNYLYVQFEFDEEWEKLTKSALFKKKDGDTYQVLLDANNMALVPTEVLDGTQFFVWCKGTNSQGGVIVPSNMVNVYLVKSGAIDDSKEPTKYIRLVDGVSSIKGDSTLSITKINSEYTLSVSNIYVTDVSVSSNKNTLTFKGKDGTTLKTIDLFLNDLLDGTKIVKKSECDSNGNNIASTYETKSSSTQKQSELQLQITPLSVDVNNLKLESEGNKGNLITSIESNYTSSSGVLKLTLNTKSGEKLETTIDLPTEFVIDNSNPPHMDGTNLVIAFTGGTVVNIDMSSLVEYATHTSTSTIEFEVGTNHEVKASVKKQSLDGTYFKSDFLASLTVLNTIASNESVRETNETNRRAYETVRISNEETRQINETQRQANETTRQTNSATAISTFNTNGQTAINTFNTNGQNAIEEWQEQAQEVLDSELISKAEILALMED